MTSQDTHLSAHTHPIDVPTITKLFMDKTSSGWSWSILDDRSFAYFIWADFSVFLSFLSDYTLDIVVRYSGKNTRSQWASYLKSSRREALTDVCYQNKQHLRCHTAEWNHTNTVCKTKSDHGMKNNIITCCLYNSWHGEIIFKLAEIKRSETLK